MESWSQSRNLSQSWNQSQRVRARESESESQSHKDSARVSVSVSVWVKELKFENLRSESLNLKKLESELDNFQLYLGVVVAVGVGGVGYFYTEIIVAKSQEVVAICQIFSFR